MHHSFHSLLNKGETFCHCKIISLAINRIAFRQVSGIICSTSDNASLPLVLIFFQWGFSMQFKKACLKWNKVQYSKPRSSETFAFEAVILKLHSL